jgi:hypothetical protein
MGAAGFLRRVGGSSFLRGQCVFQGAQPDVQGEGAAKFFAYTLKFQLNAIQKPGCMNNKKCFQISLLIFRIFSFFRHFKYFKKSLKGVGCLVLIPPISYDG